MPSIVRYTGVAIIAVAFMACPGSGQAMDLNEFYGSFVRLMKKSDTEHLECLVRKHRGLASECLAKVTNKMQAAKDASVLAAYGLLKRELTELLAVTTRRKDCGTAQKIYQRVRDGPTEEDSLVGLRRVLILCEEHQEARLQLANLDRRRGGFPAAVAGYERYLSSNPVSAEAAIGLGLTFFSAGLYRRSIPFLRKTVELSPADIRAKSILKAALREIALDKHHILSADEIVDRLWNPEGDRIMCMCPQRVPVMGRVRLRNATFAMESTLLDPRAKEQLRELAKALGSKALAGGHFLIEGHADTVGHEEYNRRLSQRRAERVRKYLVEELGVNSSTLSIAGMGELRWWTSNSYSRGRRWNRRIEIVRLGGHDGKREGG